VGGAGISAQALSGWTRKTAPEPEAVQRLYAMGKTEREIAKLLAVSRWQVAEAIRGSGIDRRLSGLPRRVPPDVLRKLVIDERRSQHQLAQMFGVAVGTMGIWLAECGLGEPDPRIDHDRLRALYMDSRLTTREVAAQFGVSHHRIIRELALAGIPRGPRHEHTRKERRIGLTAETLRELYVEQGLTIREIAQAAKVNLEYVSTRLRACGLAKRPGSFRPRVAYTAAQLRQLAVELYEAGGMTIRQVAAELGVSASRVSQALHEALAPVRLGGPPGLVHGLAPAQTVRDLYGDPAVAAVLRAHNVVMPRLDNWQPAGPFQSYAPLPLSRSLLHALYVDQGLSAFHISLVCGIGVMCVKSGLKRHHVSLRDNGRYCPWYERTYLRNR
jgi:transposase